MTDATGTTSPLGFVLGEHEPAYRDAVDRARDEAWAERLFARDGMTCLVVSHRRPLLRRADHIIVLKDGKPWWSLGTRIISAAPSTVER